MKALLLEYRHIHLIWAVLIFLLSCGGCNFNPESIAEEIGSAHLLTSENQMRLLADVERENKETNKPVIAAMNVASSLLKGLLQSIRAGQDLDISVHYDVDQALLALEDGVIDAAVFLSMGKHASGQDLLPKQRTLDTSFLLKNDIRIAESELWWATRGHNTRISEALWNELIHSSKTHWPDGTPFQLCLRRSPDPLEALWLSHRPQDKVALETARHLGQWPIFDHEDELLEHLNRTPGAIALFALGNLRYLGAPLSQLRIQGESAVNAVIYLRLSQQRQKHSVIFDRLKRLVSSPDRVNAVQEWGWLP